MNKKPTSVELKKELLKQKLLRKKKKISGDATITRKPGNAQHHPLSFSQLRLWLLDKIEGNSAHYNIASGLWLNGELEHQALEQAFTTILLRHESLRTCFGESDDGQPYQQVLPATKIEIATEDLSALPSQERQARIDELIAEEAALGFNLATDLMLRARLIKREENSHLLLVTMHHIASDGWSVGILVKEFSALYSAYTQQRPNPLPSVEIQYSDYAYWQHNWLQQEVLDQQLCYWQKQLAQLPVVHNLPLDKTRPLQQTYNGNVYCSQIGKGINTALTNLCQAHGATLFMGIHAAFSVLLSRHSNERDIVVGTPAANREQPEVAGLIGFFVNTLVLRSQLSDSSSFNDLITQSKTTLLGAFAHQQVPFEQIVEQLQPQRSASYSPLFQVALALHHNQSTTLELPGLQVSSVNEQDNIAKYDLTLNVSETSNGFNLKWEYNTDLFKESSIARLAIHFDVLLNNLVNYPDYSVFELDMLTPAEHEHLTIAPELAKATFEQHLCIHEQFERQVKLSPDAVALVFNEQQITYGELNEQANQLAHYLKNQKNITPDTLVGLCFERSIEMIIGVLAILKSGGAYVPLDPAYPSERLEYMIKDTALTCVLSQQSLLTQLPVIEKRAVCLDSPDVQIHLAAQSKEDLPVSQTGVTPADLAYIIYTSGSTGKPKGVLQVHQNVGRLFDATDRDFAFGNKDVWPLFHSIAFDFSVWEIWGALFYGGKLLVIDTATTQSPEDFIKLCQKERVSVLNQTPSAFKLFAQIANEQQALFPALRYVIFGGEALQLESLQEWWNRYGEDQPQLINMYGITETTVHVTYKRLRLDDVGRSPIGHGLKDQVLYLLDKNLNPVPKGVVGELYVGGAGLARGYLNLPQLTQERFIQNPFQKQPTERLYKTGDFMRYLCNGELEYLGRTDEQVKVRGFRIELGEIEHQLLKCPNINACIATTYPAANGDQNIVAYFVNEQKNEDTPEQPALYVLPNNRAIAYQNTQEVNFLYQEIYQNHAYVVPDVVLEKDAIVIDVGANIGIFSLFINDICPNAQVHCFEPVAPVYESLSYNAQKHGHNIKTYPYGISDREKSQQISFYPNNTVMSGSYGDVEADKDLVRQFMLNRNTDSIDNDALNQVVDSRFDKIELECEFKTLSQFIAEQKLTTIDLLKVDVEKAELDVLNGISCEDWNKIQQIIIEVHDIGGRLEKISRLLESQGFKIRVAQEDDAQNTLLYSLSGTKKTVNSSRFEAYLRQVEKASQYVLQPEKLDAPSLRRYMRSVLPDYMVPGAFVQLDAFPLTTNGKVDRKALPDPVTNRLKTEYLAPSNEKQAILCDIWQQLLGIERVSITDNFFALGGHSLMASRLVARIEQTLNISMPLKDVFILPTLEAQAEALSGYSTKDVPVFKRVSREQRLPLSFAQERLWLLSQIEDDNTHYNMPNTLKLLGQLNYQALNQAFSALYQRHESLRTCFGKDKNGLPYQHILNAPNCDIQIEDLTQLNKDDAQQRITEIITDESNLRFDLSKDLMLRTRLIKLAEQEHLISVTMHHIASDGWSMGVLIKEFSTLYQAFVENQKNPLAELTIQYADYAHWQRNWLQCEVLEEQLGYWQTQLANLPSVHNLPLDKPRPKRQTFVGSVYLSQLSAETSQALIDFCQAQGATLFMGIHAAFSVLLSRYSNQDDIVIGTSVANRDQAEIAELIGFFVNLLVLRSDLSAQPSFTALLQQSKAMLQDAYAHQQVPFEQVVERLQPERNVNHSPLFQIMLNLNNNEEEELALPGLTLAPVEHQATGLAKYDLTLNITQSPQGLELAWEYNTDLFETRSISRIAEHFEILLKNLLAKPDDCVFTAELIANSEQQALITQSSGTSADVAAECIQQLLEQQVAKSPNAVAAVYQSQQLSYSELNSRANQLAHYLVNVQAVVPDTRVGICMARSLDMLVAVLAIIKAGGAYVPLDPGYPQSRLSTIIKDADVNTILTQESVLTKMTFGSAFAVCLDDPELLPLLAEQASTNLPTASLGLKPNHLAYVIYTSGSTGKPKGVMLEHLGLYNLALAQQRGFNVTPQSRVLQFASIAFDAAISEMMVTLCAGARLVMAPQAVIKDVSQLESYIVEHEVSHATLPPALLPLLTLSNWSNVGTLILAGEVCAVSIADKWAKDRTLINAYGPSETTVCATMGVYHAHQSCMNIGKPIANSQAFVLDRHLSLLPTGVIGELFIGGVGLARGYINRPTLNKEKFISNPFYDEQDINSSKLLYRTGDLVRWLPDGNLEFLGRVDHQIKIRGFRVELGEIEHALMSHQQVCETIVIAPIDSLGNRHLTAYVVTKRNSDTGELEKQLVRHLQKQLPEYMIPAVIMRLDELPLTPNGKVDRKALPKPNTAALKTSYVAPTSQTELQLASIWKDLLLLERISATDNFFQLGGHSLLATRLLTAIEHRFNAKVALRDVFNAPTLAELATTIDDCTVQRENSIAPVSSREMIPASFAQQRLWLLDKMLGSIPLYNMFSALELTGELDYKALNRVFNAILARHESLRTCFAEDENGQPYQIIQPIQEYPVGITDLSQLDNETSHQQAKQLIDEAASLPFDLAVDLMLRAHLIKKSEKHHILLITMHHIASDGWSMGILINEFSALYQAEIEGNNKPLPLLPLQYADYAYWQRNWLQGEVLEQQLGYWEKQLTGLPPVHSLPLDSPRPPQQSFNGDTFTSHITVKTQQTLLSLCQAQGATLFMGLHAAFSVLLSRYSNETDIVIGTPVANRDQAEVADLIGFFVNTLVLRSDLSQALSFNALISQSKEMLLDAYAHQQVPFEQIVERLQPERNVNHSPLFQVMLALQNNQQSQLNLPGLTLSPIEQQSSGLAKYDLTLNATATEEGLILAWEYNTDLFREASISQLAKHFDNLLNSLLHSPNNSISAASMFTEDESKQLIRLCNDTCVAQSHYSCIHELFEEQAAVSPNAIAVALNAQQLTYDELNQRANQLAHYLKNEKGVMPETLVGICVERSLDMIIGVLAILKAGGAYVPLDPNYPTAQLKYMLDDAELKTVLTQKLVLAYTPVTTNMAICLDDPAIQNQLQGQPIDNLLVKQLGLRPNNLAYVIYTSGTTGQPKGVLLEHRGIINTITDNAKTFEVNQDSVFYQNTSFNFDAATWVIFMALSQGAALSLADSSLEFARQIQHYQASHLMMTPSMLKLIKPEEVASVTHVIVGGEACDEGLKSRWVDRVKMYNAYGPTETSICATIKVLTNNEKVSIGQPIGNTSLYVLNKQGELLPNGAVGELYIGGAGVARGYLNQADLTAVNFISNPFYDKTQTNSSERLYRTGDLARRLPDGQLDFLGRIDNQVKIRGFRIELGEIERALLACEQIKESIVLAKDNANGDKKLVAYVVPSINENSRELITVLKKELRFKLPEYMVPAVFMLLDALPLSPNGKIDHSGLPEPNLSDQQVEYIAPRNDTEIILCDIWQRLLNVDKVGITDNFFDLGGHSLLVTKLLTEIKQTLNINLQITELFDAQTIETLTQLIESKQILKHVHYSKDMELNNDEVEVKI